MFTRKIIRYFRIGERVEMIDGSLGKVISICKCHRKNEMELGPRCGVTVRMDDGREYMSQDKRLFEDGFFNSTIRPYKGKKLANTKKWENFKKEWHEAFDQNGMEIYQYTKRVYESEQKLQKETEKAIRKLNPKPIHENS